MFIKTRRRHITHGAFSFKDRICMIKKTFVVLEEHGIHARPAAKIAKTCQHLDSKVTLCKGCDQADGCSIIQVLLLAAKQGSEIEVTVEGGNEEATIAEIADLFENGSGI
jgi:phosphotransferase system HPr (HPr) family protein